MATTESTPALPEWLSACLSGGITETDADSLPPREAIIADLIEQSRSGSHDAYRRLVAIYQDRIFRFCLGWVGNVEDAEEISQDTFVKAYSALPRYRSTDYFCAWLYRIARNHCHDHYRSRRSRNAVRNRPLDGGDSNVLVSSDHQPDESAARSEDLRRLEEGIAQLPVTLREVIILCGIEGMTYDECAAILACTRRAVEGRLYRARLQLSEWLEKTGPDEQK